jgi:hypothetical protein
LIAQWQARSIPVVNKASVGGKSADGRSKADNHDGLASKAAPKVKRRQRIKVRNVAFMVSYL